MGRWWFGGLRLQRTSQNRLRSRGFFVCTWSITHGRMRRAVAHVCRALRARTLGGHARLSITMEAGFCCRRLRDFPLGCHGGRGSRLGSLTSKLALDTGDVTWKKQSFFFLSFSASNNSLNPVSWHLKIHHALCYCCVFRRACKSPSETRYQSLCEDFSTERREKNDWGSLCNLVPALKSKH